AGLEVGLQAARELEVAALLHGAGLEHEVAALVGLEELGAARGEAVAAADLGLVEPERVGLGLGSVALGLALALGLGRLVVEERQVAVGLAAGLFEDALDHPAAQVEQVVDARVEQGVALEQL